MCGKLDTSKHDIIIYRLKKRKEKIGNNGIKPW